MSKYLYNGVELPALPETHQYAPESVALDYAVIYKNFEPDTIYLKFIDKPLLAYHESIMDNRFSLRPLPITESYWGYQYKLNDNNEWEDMGGIINPIYVTNDLAAVQGVDPEGRWYQNELVWSNHDIMDSENGGVYFEGSAPKPLPTPQDFYIVKKGFGIELSALPEWDKVTYPYAIVIHLVDAYHNEYQFYASQNPFGALPEEECSISWATEANKNFLYAEIDKLSNETEWGEITTEPSEVIAELRYQFVPRRLPLWANHDVYIAEQGGTDNGYTYRQLTDELYLSASDPIPKTTAQKQDVYLRVGGQWVKQEEYLS